MFELNQLEQLIAIEQYNTISNAAQHLNISQPALSRSIQRLEEELEVSLFDRKKNKMTLNEDGLQAVEYAKRIIDLSNEMKETLINAAKARRTISIGSMAPAPLWAIEPEIKKIHPQMEIHSEMKSKEELEKGLLDNTYQIIITNEPLNNKDIICIDYCEEDLYIALPPAHPLASRKELSLSDLNGQTILQYQDVGFWLDICKAKMPDSMFLMQNDFVVLDELRKSSSLPSFLTNLTKSDQTDSHRVFIPLSDDEVNVIFYIQYKKANKDLFKDISPLA